MWQWLGYFIIYFDLFVLDPLAPEGHFFILLLSLILRLEHRSLLNFCLLNIQFFYLNFHHDRCFIHFLSIAVSFAISAPAIGFVFVIHLVDPWLPPLIFPCCHFMLLIIDLVMRLVLFPLSITFVFPLFHFDIVVAPLFLVLISSFWLVTLLKLPLFVLAVVVPSLLPHLPLFLHHHWFMDFYPVIGCFHLFILVFVRFPHDVNFDLDVEGVEDCVEVFPPWWDPFVMGEDHGWVVVWVVVVPVPSLSSLLLKLLKLSTK